MQVARNILVAFLSAWLGLPHTAWAQPPSVVDQTTLDQAIAVRAQQHDADRQAIRRMLERSQVRELAAHAGLDITRAEAAVGTLGATELHRLAEQARLVDDSLAGGQSTVTLPTTTIIIGLLVLILLIVALK